MTTLAIAILVAIYSLFHQFGWKRAILGTALTASFIVSWAWVMDSVG